MLLTDLLYECVKAEEVHSHGSYGPRSSIPCTSKSHREENVDYQHERSDYPIWDVDFPDYQYELNTPDDHTRARHVGQGIRG